MTYSTIPKEGKIYFDVDKMSCGKMTKEGEISFDVEKICTDRKAYTDFMALMQKASEWTNTTNGLTNLTFESITSIKNNAARSHLVAALDRGAPQALVKQALEKECKRTLGLTPEQFKNIEGQLLNNSTQELIELKLGFSENLEAVQNTKEAMFELIRQGIEFDGKRPHVIHMKMAHERLNKVTAKSQLTI